MANAMNLTLDILARDKTGPAFKTVEGHAKGLKTSLHGIGGALAGLGIAAFGAASVDAFANLTTGVLKMQRATGGSVEDVSRLRFALQQTGVNVDTFARSAGILDKNLVKAKESSAGIADMSKSLGTNFLDATGKIKPLTELLPKIGDTFKNMGNGPEKTALAMKLFGRAGAEMLPFLNKGKAGIDELMASADKFGLVIGPDAVAKLAAYRVAQREMQASTEGLKVAIGQDLMPAFTSLEKSTVSLLAVFNGLPGGVKSATLGVTALAAAAALAAPQLVAAGTAITGFAAAAGTSVAGTLAPVIAGMTAIAGSAALVYSSTERGGVGIGLLAQAAGGAAGPLGLLGIVMGNAAREGKEQAAAFDFIGKKLGDMVKAGDTAALTAEVARLKVEMGPETYQKFAATLSNDVKNAIGDVGTAAEETAKDVDEFTKSIEAAFSPGLALSRATDAQAESFAKLAAAAKDNGTALLGNTQKARDNRDAFTSAIEGNIGLASAVARVTAQTKDGTAATAAGEASMARSEKQLLRAGMAAGFSRKDVNAFIGSLQAAGSVTVDPKIKANTKAAEGNVGVLTSLLRGLGSSSTTAEVTVHIQKIEDLAQNTGKKGTGYNKPAAGHNRAIGGAGGGWAIVGERGAEMVMLPAGSTVLTHSQSIGEGMPHYATGRKAAPLTKAQKAAAKKAAAEKAAALAQYNADEAELARQNTEQANIAAGQDKLSAATSTRDSYLSQYASAYGSTKTSVMNFGAMSGFDLGGSSAANDAVSAAQTAANKAPASGKAAALANLKAAQDRAKESSSPGAWIAKRLEKLKRFGGVLGSLSNAIGATIAGKQIIGDILGKGPDGGTELGEALLSGGELPAILAAQNQINTMADSLGNFGANNTFSVENGNANYASTLAAANSTVSSATTSVQLLLDGKAIHESLLRRKQALGGRGLGL